MERLDKIISNLGYGSRKEIKALVKKGLVKVDGEIVKDNGLLIDPEKSVININGEDLFYREYIYLMMNKPDGVISATYDNREETVIDLLEVEHQVFDPFPVGRLDKDTVGLLLLTNDGELNHRLISPKWHVEKVYYKCKEGKLEIISSSDEGSEVMVTIQEGKYHQVKRMFEALGKTVVYLKRTEFGGLPLDQDLEEGEYRELTEDELALLKSY